VSGCWSEGELRASLDHEMPARDLERVAMHIRECVRCAEVYEELAGRASRIGTSLEALAETAPVQVRPWGRRNYLPHHWVGAAAGVAAAFTFAVTVAPRRVSPPQLPAPPPFVEPVARPIRSVPIVQHHLASRRLVARQAPARRQPPARSRVEDFVALDDQPIEAGVVVRVNLDDAANGGRIPADLILGMDGRPRAIRFVNDLSGER
jgi:hypothetical protein